MTTDKYDFDRLIDRHGTNATQIEELEEKFGSRDLLPLWIADMDFAVAPAITQAMQSRVEHPIFGYTYAPDSFWNSITDWLYQKHGWKVSREEIDYAPGVKKALGLAVCHFTNPGDKIVIQPPVYHSFHSVIEGYGRVCLENQLIKDAGGNYSMDFEALADLCKREQPKMMIVCNPHNPVGVQWDADTLNKVVDICAANDMILLSDETFGDLVLGGQPHIPVASLSPTAEKITVTLGAPSKTFNVSGIASAWVVIKNPELRKGFFDYLLTSEFDTPPVFAVTVTEAAYSKGGAWRNQLLDYLQANAEFAKAELEKIPGIKVALPGAGFSMWVDFSGLGLDQQQLMDFVTKKAKVAMNDGVSFGRGGEGFTRMNIGVPRSVLAEGIRRIAAAVADLKR